MDKDRCPLCGNANLCAVNQGGSITQCWCSKATINPAALAAVSADDQGQRCICQQCASRVDQLSKPAQ
ncbi:cysteine-rich CWC family protein [Dasania sp. GY-MA-18]|uniref:Cysteine-rich CWC family protein n=1 Tax=Dasania phycosphaerae TaxID=2950436 RepID=A0A9J6RHU0_9GAMM|nr:MULTISPECIES: cysteine-rich CWC family protein [Dasania]MCR8921477.1 cysteine-rich CWC family protein [Dasania sp. GY-MA-18]MCZ0863905.1 cysteine-rich CWC family protein [Dasania phycosphaerae]MCZ0867633.1 cysteine-rich CWC family protein [Dasania phycosphaerae]